MLNSNLTQRQSHQQLTSPSTTSSAWHHISLNIHGLSAWFRKWSKILDYTIGLIRVIDDWKCFNKSQYLMALVEFCSWAQVPRVYEETPASAKAAPTSGFTSFAFFSKSFIPASTISKPLEVRWPSLPETAPAQSACLRSISFSRKPAFCINLSGKDYA